MEDYGKFKISMFGKRNGFVQCRHGKYLRYIACIDHIFYKFQTMNIAVFNNT